MIQVKANKAFFENVSFYENSGLVQFDNICEYSGDAMKF